MRGLTRRTRFLVAAFLADAFLAVAEEVRLRFAATFEVERFARFVTFLTEVGATAVVGAAAAGVAKVGAAAGAAGVTGAAGLTPEASATTVGRAKPVAKVAIAIALVVFFISLSVLFDDVGRAGQMLSPALTGACWIEPLLCNPQASRWQT